MSTNGGVMARQAGPSTGSRMRAPACNRTLVVTSNFVARLFALDISTPRRPTCVRGTRLFLN